jgi:hypothetical protein
MQQVARWDCGQLILVGGAAPELQDCLFRYSSLQGQSCRTRAGSAAVSQPGAVAAHHNAHSAGHNGPGHLVLTSCKQLCLCKDLHGHIALAHLRQSKQRGPPQLPLHPLSANCLDCVPPPHASCLPCGKTTEGKQQQLSPRLGRRQLACSTSSGASPMCGRQRGRRCLCGAALASWSRYSARTCAPCHWLAPTPTTSPSKASDHSCPASPSSAEAVATWLPLGWPRRKYRRVPETGRTSCTAAERALW